MITNNIKQHYFLRKTIWTFTVLNSLDGHKIFYGINLFRTLTLYCKFKKKKKSRIYKNSHTSFLISGKCKCIYIFTITYTYTPLLLATFPSIDGKRIILQWGLSPKEKKGGQLPLSRELESHLATWQKVAEQVAQKSTSQPVLMEQLASSLKSHLPKSRVALLQNSRLSERKDITVHFCTFFCIFLSYWIFLCIFCWFMDILFVCPYVYAHMDIYGHMFWTYLH